MRIDCYNGKQFVDSIKSAYNDLMNIIKIVFEGDTLEIDQWLFAGLKKSHLRKIYTKFLE